ncbi:MAG: dephospho-CoA kinase [Spirosomataceae bacterium]
MKVIGITGGIGSGKSVVASILSHLGTPVYYADKEAKRLIHEKESLKAQIKRLLGEGAYNASGEYQKTWVAEKIFARPILREALNALVHPLVYTDFEYWKQKHTLSPIVAKEAAIFDNVIGYDAIIYVFAPEHIRLERLQKRDAFRPIEVTKEIIKQQQSDAEFRKIATHVLVNDNKSLLIPPILKLWESLKVD